MVAATNGNINVVNDPVYKQCIAAALLAAADQVVPQRRKPLYADSSEESAWSAQQDTREELLAIAAELDNTFQPS
jgi:hypothetical protein